MTQPWRSAALVALCLALPSSMYLVATRMQSPAEVTARAQPPQASIVTVPVERRTLRVTRRSTCTVTRDLERLTLVGAGGSGDVPVLTAVQVDVGVTLASGTVVAEVAGRPRFVIAGSFSLYRDLAPGDEGPDVVMLQAALRDLGYKIGDREGTFAAATSDAVGYLYRDRGRQAPRTGPERAAELDRAKAALDNARVLAESVRERGGGSAQAQEVKRTYDDAARVAWGAANRVGNVASRGELLVARQLPATVVALPGRVGDVATAGQPLVLGTESARLSCQAPESISGREIGVVVVIRRPDGRSFEGRVEGPDPTSGSGTGAGTGPAPSAGTASGADGQPSGGPGGGRTGEEGGRAVVPMPADRGKGSLLAVGVPPDALAGLQNGEVLAADLLTTTTAGDVLAVPLAALKGSGAEPFVEVASGGDIREVPIEVGLVADGFVEARPRSGSGFGAGAQVVVSR